MPKFEAHITCRQEQAELVRDVGAGFDWTFSAIDADPVMGPGTKCYLTAYDPEPERLLSRMTIVANALAYNGASVLRKKIERIVFDSKTGVDEITNGEESSGAELKRAYNSEFDESKRTEKPVRRQAATESSGVPDAAREEDRGR